MQKRVKNLMVRANKNLVGAIDRRKADNDLMNYLEYEWLEDPRHSKSSLKFIRSIRLGDIKKPVSKKRKAVKK